MYVASSSPPCYHFECTSAKGVGRGYLKFTHRRGRRVRRDFEYFLLLTPTLTLPPTWGRKKERGDYYRRGWKCHSASPIKAFEDMLDAESSSCFFWIPQSSWGMTCAERFEIFSAFLPFLLVQEREENHLITKGAESEHQRTKVIFQGLTLLFSVGAFCASFSEFSIFLIGMT